MTTGLGALQMAEERPQLIPPIRVRRVPLFGDGDVAVIRCFPRMRCGLFDTVCNRGGRIPVSKIGCATRKKETRRSGFQQGRPTALFGELVPDQLVVGRSPDDPTRP